MRRRNTSGEAVTHSVYLFFILAFLQIRMFRQTLTLRIKKHWRLIYISDTNVLTHWGGGGGATHRDQPTKMSFPECILCNSGLANKLYISTHCCRLICEQHFFIVYLLLSEIKNQFQGLILR